MSTILKALKKLEEEKQAAEATVDFSRKILTNTQTHPRKSSAVIWVAVGMATGLLLAVAVFAGFLRREPPVTDNLSSSRMQPLVKVNEQPPAGAMANPAAPGPSPLVSKEVSVASVRPAPIAAKPAESLFASPTQRTADAGAEDRGKAELQLQRTISVERHEIPAPGQQWAAPHLVVGDILPASGGGRMAIVNGLPVMEGTMVENAVVREIRIGQVVFEVEGKSIVVPLERRP